MAEEISDLDFSEEEKKLMRELGEDFASAERSVMEEAGILEAAEAAEEPAQGEAQAAKDQGEAKEDQAQDESQAAQAQDEGQEGEEPQESAEEQDDGGPESKESGRGEITLEEIREANDRLQREVAGLRSDLIAERQRRQAAEAAFRPPEAEPVAGNGEKDDAYIPVELGEDGEYRIPKDQLQRILGQQVQQQQPAQQQPVALPPDPRREAFEAFRATEIQSASDPNEAAREIDTLFEATQFLDAKVGELLPRFQSELQTLPPGVGRAIHIIERSGLDKEFAEKYPGADYTELVTAALHTDPALMRHVRENYRRRRAEMTRPAQKVEDPSTLVRPTHEEGRPRPMASRGTAPRPDTRASQLGRYADMDPDELLSLSDDEFRELERLAAQQEGA